MLRYLNINRIHDHFDFEKHISRDRYIIQRMDDLGHFNTFNLSRYSCFPIRGAHVLEFGQLGEECNIGQDKFIALDNITSPFWRLMIVGQRTGDRYFTYGYWREKTGGLAMMIPLFFDWKKNWYFISLLNKEDNVSLDFQGMTTNRWEVEWSWSLNINFEKGGEVDTDMAPVSYKIPIYDYAPMALRAAQHIPDPRVKTKLWYETGLSPFPRWDQGKEIIWLERAEKRRPQFF